METSNYNNQRGNSRSHNSGPRQFDNSDNYNQRGRGRGRGQGRGRGHGGNRGGGGGGRGNFRGSKNDMKNNRKDQYHNRAANNNSYRTTDLGSNLPVSIDLTNEALVEHIGEIFFKESFLEDPWKKVVHVPEVQENLDNQENYENQGNDDNGENQEDVNEENEDEGV